MKKRLLIAAVLVAIALAVGHPAQKVEARPCGKNWFSRVGCALDPFNPARNGGVVAPAIGAVVSGPTGALLYDTAAATMRTRHLDRGAWTLKDGMRKQLLRERFGDLVDNVYVVFHANLVDRWCTPSGKTCMEMSKKWPIGGMTFCDVIYIREPEKSDDTAQLVLLAHEFRHAEQCLKQGGSATFGYRYFKSYVDAGWSYDDNQMEIDAENTAKDFIVNTICGSLDCVSGRFDYLNFHKYGLNSYKVPAVLSREAIKPFYDPDPTTYLDNPQKRESIAAPETFPESNWMRQQRENKRGSIAAPETFEK